MKTTEQLMNDFEKGCEKMETLIREYTVSSQNPGKIKIILGSSDNREEALEIKEMFGGDTITVKETKQWKLN